MADFGFIPDLVAGADVFPFRFVKLATTAEFTGIQASAATDIVVGVTDGSIRQASPTITNQVNAASGDPINLQSSNTVQVELGAGGATVGALLTSDANGKAVVAASTNLCFYQALQAGANGDIVRAFRIGTRVAP